MGVKRQRSAMVREAVPKKIRELMRDLGKTGWVLEKGAGKGSHRKYWHPRVKYLIILSGNEGADAHRYQERDVRRGIEDASQAK